MPPEEIARRKAEREAPYQQTRLIFEKIKPESIADRYNWFMIVEPKSGDYSIFRKKWQNKKHASNIQMLGWLLSELTKQELAD